MHPEIYSSIKRYVIMFLIATVILVCAVCVNKARAEEVNLDIIAQIESSGDPRAYNPNTDARGLYQITPICLKEYNNHHRNSPILSANALFCPEISRKVAEWYLTVRIPQMLSYYHKSNTVRNCIIAYNAGIRAVVKSYLPEETEQYLKKYARLAKG